MSSSTVNPTNNLQQLNQDDVLLDEQKNQNTQDDIFNAGSSQCLTKNINDEQNIQRSPEEIESLICLYCEKCEKNVEKDNSDKEVKICLNCKSKLHYRCRICKKLFSCRRYLYGHLKFKCNLKFYKCSICAERFQSSLSLNAHINTVHDLNINKCQKCGKQFGKYLYLLGHQRFCGVEANIKCQDCNYATNSRYSLEEHKLRKHVHIKLEDYYKCSKCKNTFKTKHQLSRHVSRKHRYIKPQDHHQCSQCSRTFKRKHNLLKHISREHTLTSNNSRPEISCDKKFKSNKNLKLHKKSIHNPVTNRKCQYCNFVTKSLKLLKIHILNRHVEREDYQKCSECEKLFKTKTQLLEHIRICVKK